MNTPMRDMIVVLPGITGSVLSSVGHDGDHRDVWAISGGALWRFLTRVEQQLDLLTLPPHDPAAELPATPLIPTGLIPGFHGVFGLAAVDGYATLVRTLLRALPLVPGNADNDEPVNFVEFPYDWRLSCRHSAHKLKEMVDRKLGVWREYIGEPDARVIVVAHSMGGLVARYWLEVLDGWPSCRFVASFGTPYRGSIDSAGYVANGYKKAFVDLSAVLRGCPSVYELMPFYRTVEFQGEWRRPSEVPVPHADDVYLAAGAAFHQEIQDAVKAHLGDDDYLHHRYLIFPYVGIGQTTQQSAALTTSGLTLSTTLPDYIDAHLDGGDARVPRASGTPLELSDDHRETFLAQQHGSLQNHAAVLDDLVERIKQSQSHGLREIQGEPAVRETAIDVRVDEMFLPGEEVQVRATPRGWSGEVMVTVGRDGPPPQGADAPPEPHVVLSADGDGVRATMEGLTPGRYRVTVRPARPRALGSVTALFEVGE